MRDIINYHYQIYPEFVYQEKYKYYFYFQNNKYIFKPFTRDIKDQKLIDTIIEELKRQNILLNEVVSNKKREMITEYDGIPYVLIRVLFEAEKNIDLFDIVNLQYANVRDDISPKHNWLDLWSRKIDYFEYQISEIEQDSVLVKNSFNYFVGVWENAISYLRSVITNHKPTNLDKPTVNHKRVNVKTSLEEFYDPINIIIDHKSRDLSEYLKSLIFTNGDYIQCLTDYLNYSALSNFGAGLLFSRLLFPSFYFDVFQDVVERRRGVEDLYNICDKINAYELFLKDIYTLLDKYYKLEPIDWILKK